MECPVNDIHVTISGGSVSVNSNMTQEQLEFVRDFVLPRAIKCFKELKDSPQTEFTYQGVE